MHQLIDIVKLNMFDFFKEQKKLRLIVVYEENFHGKISMNFRPLFMIFILLFGCSEPNLGYDNDRDSVLLT